MGFRLERRKVFAEKWRKRFSNLRTRETSQEGGFESMQEGSMAKSGGQGRSVADRFQEIQRKRLLEQISSSAQHREGLLTDMWIGENSSFSTHPATAAPNMSSFYLIETIKGECQAKRALQKMQEGTYEICDECGKKINRKRLKALPHALNCIDCQTKKEQQRRTSRRNNWHWT